MRQRLCLGVVALGFAVVSWGWDWNRGEAVASPIAQSGLVNTGLITHVQDVEGRPLRVIIIDPALRVMGVYDIAKDTGEIQPKSVRNISADLRMLEFNSSSPSPAEIQKTLDRQ